MTSNLQYRFRFGRHLMGPALLAGAILGLTGCEQTITAPPAALESPLRVQASQTAIGVVGDLFRIQVTFDITGGRLGAGSKGRVCLGGSCDEAPIAGHRVEGDCSGVALIDAGDARFGLASMWNRGAKAGVEICVDDMSARRLFETTIWDGHNRSNPVRTVCLPGGPGPFCGSQ